MKTKNVVDIRMYEKKGQLSFVKSMVIFPVLWEKSKTFQEVRNGIEKKLICSDYVWEQLETKFINSRKS